MTLFAVKLKTMKLTSRCVGRAVSISFGLSHFTIYFVEFEKESFIFSTKSTNTVDNSFPSLSPSQQQ